ncbi:MAG TPA: glutaminyl-peptide cyclotransferase [Chthonomonadaceae bacterium]|nr:glutaminyl-peptide cyclotransferase [Chthonomonadaceae bacterium]
MFRRSLAIFGFALISALAGCSQNPEAPGAGTSPPAPAQSAPDTGSAENHAVQPAAVKSSVPIYTADVKHTYPHDPHAFTQGLIYIDGYLYESTGLNGQSSLRKVELESGKVLQKIDVPSQYFAEGMTLFQGKIYQITWKEQKCFVYNPKTFQKEGELTYTGEGWGLTHDDKLLIMSDGTNTIRFRDPATFEVKRSITIMNPNNGKPLDQLNELEYIKGEIYANIWQTDAIVRIDPQSGKVVGMIDLTDLYPLSTRSASPGADPPDVLNGIAYDAGKDRLFVTGKRWPKLYEITLKKQP